MEEHPTTLAKPAHPLDLTQVRARARPRSRWASKFRQTFSRESLKEFGTTLALVVPLTILIWVWAEREQTEPYKAPFVLSVLPSDPTQIMSLLPETSKVAVELQGPRSGIEAMKDAIAKDRTKATLSIDVGTGLKPGGPYDVPIDSMLDQQKLFRDHGISVVGTEPGTVKVMVDRVVERDLQVKVPAELEGRVQSAMVEPPTVKVRGPAAVLDQLESSGKLRAELDLKKDAEILGARPGTRMTLQQVALVPIDAPNVTFAAREASRVVLQLSQEEQGEIKSVVVFVKKPAALEGRVTVNVTPLVLTSVRVIGPSDVVRQLREDRIEPRPAAVVTIRREDIGTSGLRQPVFTDLPPGVRVVEGSVSPVQFQVTPTAGGSDGSRAAP